jgi:copper(I)-binding protein
VRYGFLFVVALALALLASWLLVLRGSSHSRIEVGELWVAETGTSRAMIHGTIANRGASGDRLLRISSGAASGVAILDQFGREIEGLKVPADSELVLGGEMLRIEATGLRRPNTSHGTLPLVLVFERAGELAVDARIEPALPGTQ